MEVNRPRKIFHVCYEYPPVGGGGGTACQNIVEQLATKNVFNFVLTSRVTGLGRWEKSDGVCVRRLRCFRKHAFQSTVWEMFWFLLIAFPYAIYYQLKNRFDLVHIHFVVPSGPIGLVLKWFFGLPYVCTVQGGEVPSFVPEQTKKYFRWIKWFTIPIWRSASGVYAVSDGLAELAREDYPGVKIDVIPNGVSDEFFVPTKKSDEKEVQLVFAGRMAVQKRVDVLVKALAHLRGRKDWKAKIIGDGPFFKPVSQLANKLGVSDRVQFCGWLDKEQLIDKLKDSDIFVLPSRSEGLPLVGVQALASGLPVLGSDVVGIRDIIDSGRNGYLFPFGDDEKLAETIETLLDSKELREKLSGRSDSGCKKISLGKYRPALRGSLRLCPR